MRPHAQLGTDLLIARELAQREENATSVALAADAVTEQLPHAFVAFVNWWETLPAAETAALAGFGENGRHGHGGAVEKSRALPGGPVPLVAAPHALVPGEGYHGRPSELDRAHGAVLLELAARRIGASIDRLPEALERP